MSTRSPKVKPKQVKAKSKPSSKAAAKTNAKAKPNSKKAAKATPKPKRPPRATPAAREIVDLDFAAANRRWKLTRHGQFDAGFTRVLAYDGTLTFAGGATGKALLAAFGAARRPAEAVLLVVTGDLRIRGALDLDAGVDHSIAVAVLGTIEAEVIRIEEGSLFGFAGAKVARAIVFDTDDGTLAIANATTCPLVFTRDGDLSLQVNGMVVGLGFASAESAPARAILDDFVPARITTSIGELADQLEPGACKAGELDLDRVFARAVKGLPILRPGVASTKPAVASGARLERGSYVTTLASDGTEVWAMAEGLLAFDGARFRCTATTEGLEGPGASLAVVDGRLVSFGYYDRLQASHDGIAWTRLLPEDANQSKSTLFAGSSEGVACCVNGRRVFRARHLKGPWSEVELPLPSGVFLTSVAIAVIGGATWISLRDRFEDGWLFVVEGTSVRRVDYGSHEVVNKIVAWGGRLLFLGTEGLHLISDDHGATFRAGKRKVKGCLWDALLVGDVLYAVGGPPLGRDLQLLCGSLIAVYPNAPSSRRPKFNHGFLARSQDRGETFEIVENDLPGRMWTIARRGTELFLGGLAGSVLQRSI